MCRPESPEIKIKQEKRKNYEKKNCFCINGIRNGGSSAYRLRRKFKLLPVPIPRGMMKKPQAKKQIPQAAKPAQTMDRC